MLAHMTHPLIAQKICLPNMVDMHPYCNQIAVFIGVFGVLHSVAAYTYKQVDPNGPVTLIVQDLSAGAHNIFQEAINRFSDAQEKNIESVGQLFHAILGRKSEDITRVRFSELMHDFRVDFTA